MAKKCIFSQKKALEHLELNKLESQLRKSDDKYIAQNQSGFEEENEIDNVQNLEEYIETDLKFELQEDANYFDCVSIAQNQSGVEDESVSISSSKFFTL